MLSHPLRLIFFKDAVINELSKAVVSKHLISEKIHSVEVWNAIFNFIKTVKDREKREELVEVWNECVSDIKANFIENRQLLHDYGVEMSNL